MPSDLFPQSQPKEGNMNADLKSLGLSVEAVSRRVLSIGGSDANILMSGDAQAVLALWECKTGRRDPDDLSGVLPVVMGQFTEPLNAAWFEKQTGLSITRRGEALAHPEDEWRTATLDGAVNDAVWEAKHVGSFWKDEAILAKYQPQLHHNMAVAGAVKAYLSVFKGNADWLHFEVSLDLSYAAAVRKAEWSFWMAVQADEPPVPYDAPQPPPADAMREVDMTLNNAWASFAADWLETRAHAKRFETATKEIKALVEADVKLATGHGIACSRSKAGALTIKEVK